MLKHRDIKRPKTAEMKFMKRNPQQDTIYQTVEEVKIFEKKLIVDRIENKLHSRSKSG
jgi:hypothetical protein